MGLGLLREVDGNDLATAVVMLRTSDPNMSCLLVEGTSDKTIYGRFVDQNSCQIVICYGKENLITALNLLNWSGKYDGYLGIGDADFDILNGITAPFNLVHTDGHDLEVMICISPALEKYIETSLSSECDSYPVSEISREIRAQLFDIGSTLGYLHWLNDRHRWGLALPIHELLQLLTDDNRLPLDRCVSALDGKFAGFDSSRPATDECERLCSVHAYHLCRGHDLIVVLPVLFSRVTRKHLHKKVNPGEVERQLLVAYEFAFFRRTSLYADIRQWEENNKPLVILVADW